LLVNDLQQRMVESDSPAYAPAAAAAVERLGPLLAYCRAQAIPTVFALIPEGQTRIQRPGDERLAASLWRVADALQPGPADLVFQKPYVANGLWPISGLWQDTPVDAHLRAHGRDRVLIAGTTLQYGCDTAVREASNRGYHVAALRDCCAVRPIPDHGWGAVAEADVERVVFSAWAQWFARLLTAAEALAELSAQNE
jgi:nicotinamidase-related amidase